MVEGLVRNDRPAECEVQDHDAIYRAVANRRDQFQGLIACVETIR